MTLDDFIAQVLAEYGLPFQASSVRSYVVDQARKVATRNVACIDDDTVKDWIINYSPNKGSYEEKALKKAEVKTVAPPIQKKFKPVKVEEKKEEKKDVQLSLFDIL